MLKREHLGLLGVRDARKIFNFMICEPCEGIYYLFKKVKKAILSTERSSQDALWAKADGSKHGELRRGQGREPGGPRPGGSRNLKRFSGSTRCG